MAVSGDCFFDSSNLRYVLANHSWFVAIDHEEQLALINKIGVSRNDVTKKGLGFKTFLFGDEFIKKNLKTKLIKENAQSIWLKLEFTDARIIESFIVQFNKKPFLPEN